MSWFLIVLTVLTICIIVLLIILLILTILDYRFDFFNKTNTATIQLNNVSDTQNIIECKVPFSFSRREALEYIDNAADNIEKYKITPLAKMRKRKYFSDSFRVGDRCFALMYVKKGVVRLSVRLGTQIANDIIHKYPTASISKFPKGGSWVDIIANETSFKNKQQIFTLLDKAYTFVINKYYNEV